MTYIIESMRTHAGVPTEREAKRKGQRVEILSPNVGQPLVLVYRDDHNHLLQGTQIERVEDAGPDVLTITTRNYVYTFIKGGCANEIC
ncbi:hypothetical protein [Paenibacillus sp. SN-8-1]|uniref:hypothetical protein n=1 Tax=Paenibacillus sp. SN-8-1 TaxID=3435409 RepID=UPI003D9A763B